MHVRNWSDSADATRSYTFTTDAVVLVLNYEYDFQLSLSAYPAGAASFTTSPESESMYFPANTQVVVNTEIKAGYKFLRWLGDVAGGTTGASVLMSGTRSAEAVFEKVPYVSPTGVRNAAGETPDEVVAPGSLIAITGANLVESFVAGPATPLAQTVAGVYVTLGDRFLPLVSVAPDQIVALLGSDVAAGDYTLKVYIPGQSAAKVTMKVARNAPGLFTSATEDGTVYALAIHEDGTAITPSSRARKGETITLYGTGFGPYDKQIVDGFALPAKPVVTLADTATLTLDTAGVTPSWTGAAPERIGVVGVRFKVPDTVTAGSNVKVTAVVNSRESNTVPLPVE
jgi:uncharacterized protein (TIGR03437 family)